MEAKKVTFLNQTEEYGDVPLAAGDDGHIQAHSVVLASSSTEVKEDITLAPEDDIKNQVQSENLTSSNNEVVKPEVKTDETKKDSPKAAEPGNVSKIQVNYSLNKVKNLEVTKANKS